MANAPQIFGIVWLAINVPLFIVTMYLLFKSKGKTYLKGQDFQVCLPLAHPV